MSWLEVVAQLELDADAYERLAADPEAPVPLAWTPTSVGSSPPPELRPRLAAVLVRLRAAEHALAAAGTAKADELAALLRPADPTPVARYLDTTA